MIEFDSCMICPRKCGVNRNKGMEGFCHSSNVLKVARYSLHMWEEPVISSVNGSGTIFFSGCNLKCLFCQNYDIAVNNKGREITLQEFKDICLTLQRRGAHNINLVTPTHYIPLIKEGLILAKKEGLSIPIVYNSSGYENSEALKSLDGLVDIYMPDFKYFDDTLGMELSLCDDYSSICKDALREMYRQVGNIKLDDGLMKKGVIVRVLVLPSKTSDSKKIIKYLYDTYGDNIYISIMNQYTPCRHIDKYDFLNRKVSSSEYDDVVNYALDIGVKNAFIQEGDTQSESFIPDFDQFVGV